MSAYLDTHVTLWLYAGETARISKRAANLINGEALLASPIVLLELQYSASRRRGLVTTDRTIRKHFAALERPPRR